MSTTMQNALVPYEGQLQPVDGTTDAYSTMPKIHYGTREQWCEDALAALIPRLAAEPYNIRPVGDEGAAPREVRVAVAPLPDSKLGVCYPAKRSASKTVNLITISTQNADPITLLLVLTHEYLHAADDCRSHHKLRWRRWADSLGIQAKGTARSPACQAMLEEVLAEIGTPARHAASVTSAPVQKAKSQIKFSCPGCLRHVHMPLAVAVDGFELACVRCVQLLQRAE